MHLKAKTENRKGIKEEEKHTHKCELLNLKKFVKLSEDQEKKKEKKKKSKVPIWFQTNKYSYKIVIKENKEERKWKLRKNERNGAESFNISESCR